MKKISKDLEDLAKNVTHAVNLASTAYKGAARIGTDISEDHSGDESKLSMIQEATLSAEERKVLKFILRGFSSGTIARVLNRSESSVNALRSKIRAKITKVGESVDQAHLVGYTVSVFEEVEEKAWEMYYRASEDKGQRDRVKALELVMKAREKQLKLLMDVGLLQKAENVVTHEVTMTPFLEKWDQNGRQAVAKAVIESTLDKLADPVAPDDTYEGQEDQEPPDSID